MLTGVVLAKNEASLIEACLKSLKFCDQILVIDDNSTDDTAKIAEKLHAKCVSHPLNSNFANQRNFALSLVSEGWVLFLDADEVVTNPLAGEIKAFISSNTSQNGAYIKRTDLLWGAKLTHGDLLGAKFIRLGKVGAGEWKGPVHEVWNLPGVTATLSAPLEHQPHQNIAEFLHHLNVYSSLKADEFSRQKKYANFIYVLLAPKVRFLKLYIFKLGFLDGTAGFIHAMLMAFYAFLVAGKTWLSYHGVKDSYRS